MVHYYPITTAGKVTESRSYETSREFGEAIAREWRCSGDDISFVFSNGNPEEASVLYKGNLIGIVYFNQ